MPYIIPRRPLITADFNEQLLQMRVWGACMLAERMCLNRALLTLYRRLHGSVAQLVEQTTLNRPVLGSSPS